MTTIADHDAYIAAAPEPFQPSLKLLRAILARALPEAEEVVAYNMPGFRIGGSIVASYAAFSKQCGLYFLPGAISEHAEEIAAAGLKEAAKQPFGCPLDGGIRRHPGHAPKLRLSRSTANLERVHAHAAHWTASPRQSGPGFLA